MYSGSRSRLAIRRSGFESHSVRTPLDGHFVHNCLSRPRYSPGGGGYSRNMVNGGARL